MPEDHLCPASTDPGKRGCAPTLVLVLLTTLLALLLLVPDHGGRLESPLFVEHHPSVARLAHNAAGMLYDDGYYYLEIARHVATGRGSTFDGRHPTNGYHPLWLLCLIPLVVVARSAPAMLIGVFALQTVLAAATTLLVFRSAERLAARAFAWVAALLWLRVQAVYWSPWSGMEYALNAFLVAALLHVFVTVLLPTSADRTPAETFQESLVPRRAAGLGLLAALALLARLDNALLGLLIGLALVRRGRRTFIIYALPVVLTAVAYALVNVSIFGHPLPVSGAVKRAWSEALLAADPWYLSSGWLGAKIAGLLWPFERLSRGFALALTTGLIGAAATVVLWIARRAARWQALMPVAVFALGQVAIYVGLYHDGFSYQPWHFVAQPWLAAIVVAITLDVGTRRWLPRNMHAVVAAGIALLLVLSTARALDHRRDRLRGFGQQPLVAAAVWTRDRVDPDATVGAWNAGLIAFFSDRRVVNLDGLVNSWTFFREGRHALCTYLLDERIEYLIDVFPPGRSGDRLPKSLEPCRGRFEAVWSGPSYAPGRDAAAAFRLRREPGS